MLTKAGKQSVPKSDQRRAVSGAIVVAVVTMPLLYTIYMTIGFWGGVAATHIPPYILGAVNLLLPILAGTLWFRLKIVRSMSHAERLIFALCVTLANIIVTAVVAYITSMAVPLSAPFFLQALLFMFLHFVVAYGFGWLITRNYGDRSETP